MRTFVIYLKLVFFGLALTGCDSHDKPVPPFGTADELVVIAVKHTDDFYQNAEGGFSGLSYDLLNEFAHELGLKIKFVMMQQSDEALAALLTQQGHLAVGLDIPAKQRGRLRLGPIYQQKQHQVAYHPRNIKPENFQQLVGKKIVISTGAVFETQLKKIQQERPGFNWSAADISTDRLLEKLAAGEIAYTISDSDQIKRARLFYSNSNLGMGFNLDEKVDSQWIFSQFAEQTLISKINNFFTRVKQDGTLNRLIDRHSGHLERLSGGDIHFFLRTMRMQLSDFREIFYQAEALTEIDWRLIAALAYQESHWNPQAISPTGVRGIMMLTSDTAKRMKVTNRLDAQQSIFAGARYLQSLKNKLPLRITEPDRTWIALAAYNQGYGHIIDARTLARRFKLNPDLWIDVKKMLPLLSQKQYFDTLKHGYTRGGQAVILTESVRAYYEIIKKYHHPYYQDMSASAQTILLP